MAATLPRGAQSGWKGEKGTAIACTGETRQFYDAVARFAERFGYLSVYFLQHGAVTIAAHFGLTYAGRYYPLKIAYDENYSQYRPGHSIAGAVLEDCARHGIQEFDWLGHWTEAKAKWTSEERRQNFCYIFRGTLPGRALYWEARLQERVGDRLESAIRKLLHPAA
jgi:CelD/BcsL family acetyltransferase involved in cellulose biosynthesis